MPKVFNGTARKFIFTDFERTKTENELKAMVGTEHVRHIMWGDEVCPETKKEHRQGRIEFDMSVRRAHVQKVIGNKCHVQPERDTEKSIQYVQKEGHVVSAGEPLKQGERTDIKALHTDVKAGKSTTELGDLHTAAWYKYSGSVDKMTKALALENKPEFKEMEIHVIIGSGGWGKSHWAECQLGGKSICKVTKSSFEGGKFIDHYNGEPVLQLDDFNGGWMKHEDLLNLLDGYAYWVNKKYGGMWAKWTHIVLTSNVHYNKWYTDLWQKFPDLYKAFTGRVKKFTVLKGPIQCAHRLNKSECDGVTKLG